MNLLEEALFNLLLNALLEVALFALIAAARVGILRAKRQSSITASSASVSMICNRCSRVTPDISDSPELVQVANSPYRLMRQ